ncbi:MAG: hypothetical protein AB1696_10905 [Planctomycetota bacterium]
MKVACISIFLLLTPLIGCKHSPVKKEVVPTHERVVEALQKLQAAGKKSPDLIKKEYRHLDRSEIELNGLCYVLAECVYHLFPGEFKSYYIKWDDGMTHWFLRYADGTVLDPIGPDGKPFCTQEEYATARRAAFLTKAPSKRAQRLLERAGLALSH